MVRLFLIGLIYALFSGSDIDHELHPVDSYSINLNFDGSTLKGTVTLPATNTAQRTFRGSAYRNRRTTSSTNSSNGMDSNPFTNTIISLHPLSRDVDASPLDKPSVINQENATFVPHVTPVVVGSIVEFVNNDSFYHNVFSLTPGAKFNIGRRPTGDSYSKEIPRTQWKIEGLGEIQLFCDIHSSMNAVILSLNTPYFQRVNEDGTFEISDIPSGTYELRGYNPNFEITAEEVTLDGENSMTLDLNFMN